MNKTAVIAGLAAGILGVGAGYAAGNAGEPDERVVFAAAATETHEVPATPDICVVALSRADTALDTAGQGFSIMSDAFYAIAVGDSRGLNYAAGEIEALTPSIESAMTLYQEAAAECRELVPAVAG